MMTFKQWKQYWKQMDWSRKWFPLFILLRPITDNFYKLKEISTVLSPIYILGVLTPVLCIASLANTKRKRNPVLADEAIRIWGVFTFLSAAVLLIFFFSIDTLGDVIKYITPVLVYFFLRNFIQSKDDLRFILQTFLYSAIFPFCMMYFEILVHPIDPEFASEGRGGGARIRGQYADSMNYAIYLVGTFLCYGYFFLEEIHSKTRERKTSPLRLTLIFIVCVGAAISLRHVATWGVFLTLGVLLTFFNSQNSKGLIFVIFIALIILPFFARPIYDKEIYPLVAKEYGVIQGDKEIGNALDGRVSRWQRYFEIWGEMSPLARFAGTPYSGDYISVIMTGGGMHNDYVRNIFLSGLIGCGSYVFFFFIVLSRRGVLRKPERFLLIGGVAIVMLYSMTTLPTIYPGLFGLAASIYSFALLPKSQAYGTKQQNNVPISNRGIPGPTTTPTVS